MKKLLFLVAFLCMFASCRSGLYLVNDAYVNARTNDTKSFSIDDFEVYVFKLCEDYKIRRKDSLMKRFCDCPEGFFTLPETKDIRKIEEIYLLKHKTSNMILYLTTFSHKYIKKKKGFLNDSTIYKNKIILNQIETIYVGKLDIEKHKIHFEGNQKLKDITFYFDPNEFPQKMVVTKGNMTTAENNYSVAETIPLKDVFRNDISYNMSGYTIDYYVRNNYKKAPAHVSEINIVSEDDDIEVIFKFNDFEEHYKLASKRIRYHPSYESIVEAKK